MIKKKERKRNSRASHNPAILNGGVETQTASLKKITNPFPYHVYDIMRDYSLLFPDFSQAVANLQFTANCHPRIDVEFLESTKSDKQRRQILIDIGKIVSSFWRRVYRSSVNGFVIDSLGQIARNGALSAEIVLDKDVTRVNELVHVPVRDIEFFYNKDQSLYPAQVVRSANVQKAAKSLLGSTYINLDIPTYFYMPLETIEGSPYGIPPFLSAVEKLVTQQNIMDNLSVITKKLGLLGFLKVLVEAPQREPSEDASSYRSRVKTYLDESAKTMNANFSRGVVVGLKDQMDIEYQGVAGDARGVSQIVQIIEEQIASAFKQDPALFGRTYSTTETYAGVVYDKFINTLQHYTTILSNFLREALIIELELNGIKVADIRPTFAPPKSLTSEIDAKAESIKTATILTRRDAGIIDQNQAAKEMGYDHPASPEPLDFEAPKERNRVDNDSASKKTKNSVVYSFSWQSGGYECADEHD